MDEVHVNLMFTTLLLLMVWQIAVAFWINNIGVIVISETDLFASLSHEKSTAVISISVAFSQHAF